MLVHTYYKQNLQPLHYNKLIILSKAGSSCCFMSAVPKVLDNLPSWLERSEQNINYRLH